MFWAADLCSSGSTSNVSVSKITYAGFIMVSPHVCASIIVLSYLNKEVFLSKQKQWKDFVFYQRICCKPSINFLWQLHLLRSISLSLNIICKESFSVCYMDKKCLKCGVTEITTYGWISRASLFLLGKNMHRCMPVVMLYLWNRCVKVSWRNCAYIVCKVKGLWKSPENFSSEAKHYRPNVVEWICLFLSAGEVKES